MDKSCCFHDLLSASLDGELSPSEQVQLDEHLLVCESCRKALDEYRKLTSLLGGIPDASVPNGLVENVLKETTQTLQANKEVSTLIPKSRFAGARWMRWSAAVAAVFLLVVLWNGLPGLNDGNVTPLLTSIVAIAEEEWAALDMVFSFDPSRISVKSVESALADSGFLMVSNIGSNEIRVSMASSEAFGPDGGVTVLDLRIMPMSSSDGKSSFLRLETARAYRLDGRPASVTLDQISAPLPEQSDGNGCSSA